MGSADQYAKRVLEAEAPTVTNGAVAFALAAEIATPALTPDGLLTVCAAPALAALPAPWSLLRDEAVVELKMPGDHLDHAALARCVLRWQARWTQRLEAGAAPGFVARPDRHALWVLAPHVPLWITDAARDGWLTATPLAPGCTRLGPYPFALVWIAANELPLEPALLPLLIARTGLRFQELVRWALGRRPPAWIFDLLRFHPEGTAMLPKLDDLQPDADQDARFEAALRELLQRKPARVEPFVRQGREQGLAQGLERGLERGLEQGLEQGLERGLERGLGPLRHQFERRLGRALSAAEHRVLGARLGTLGPARVGDVVLDLAPDALATWLADPDAR